MKAIEQTKPLYIKMGTNCVMSWIDSYQDIIDCYTANGWKDGGEWYFITLKSGHQLYGFDEEDSGSFCLPHEDWVGYEPWDITEEIKAPEAWCVDAEGWLQWEPGFVAAV